MQLDSSDLREIFIEEVDLPNLSDADVLALNVFSNVLRAESDPDDPPIPVEVTASNVRNIPALVSVREFWARDRDGSIAASGEASWLRTEENRHLAQMGIAVRADRRTRGIGRALLGLLVDAVEGEGRTLLMGVTSDRVPAGDAFARRVGAEAASAQHTNRVVLSDVDRALLQMWIDEGPVRAPGYRLLAMDGAYPDEWVEQVATVHRVMNTAPRDELDMEDYQYTVDQVRQFEQSILASGNVRWSLFALHEDSGQLVGFTEVSWNPKLPQTVAQWGTGVHPDHRGHALGKWLKATMLDRILRELPEAVDVRTGNADSNDAMLGINRQLGFRPYHAHTWWQVPVEQARAYLER